MHQPIVLAPKTGTDEDGKETFDDDEEVEHLARVQAKLQTRDRGQGSERVEVVTAYVNGDVAVTRGDRGVTGGRTYHVEGVYRVPDMNGVVHHTKIVLE